jgi:hypothetical protein
MVGTPLDAFAPGAFYLDWWARREERAFAHPTHYERNTIFSPVTGLTP